MEQKTVYLIMEDSTENLPRLVIGCYADKEKAKQYLDEWAVYVGATEKPRGRYRWSKKSGEEVVRWIISQNLIE